MLYGHIVWGYDLGRYYRALAYFLFRMTDATNIIKYLMKFTPKVVLSPVKNEKS